MLRRARNKADNLPTNPSSGETARVGWRAAIPYKRPSNPENQTVVVIKSSLALDPCLRRLPAGDGKGGTGQGKGRQGRGVCRPVGQVSLTLSYRDRCKSARGSRKPQPDHPEPKKTRGTKRSKGNPTNPEEAKRQKTRKTEKKSTKCLGKRLQDHVQQSGEVVQHDCGQLETSRRQKKQQQRKQTNSSPVIGRVS